MSALEELQCTRCGSVDLEEVSPGRFKCAHCGCHLQGEVSGSSLSVDFRRCPECGQENDRDASYCGKCGFRLVRPCPRCGKLFRWDMVCCPECGFRQDPDERFIHLLTGGPGEFWVLTSRKLYHRVANLLIQGFVTVPLEDVWKVRFRRGLFHNKLKILRRHGKDMVIRADGNEELYRHLKELTGV